jgi:hypothetical protein
MITNSKHYLKRIPTEDEIAQCHKLLDEQKIEHSDVFHEADGTTCLEDVLENMKEEIHIGKISGGWRFLFHIHDDRYERSINSCLEYIQHSLDSGRWQLKDEYGRSMPVEELEKIIRGSLNGITHEDFLQTHPEEERISKYFSPEVISSDGSRWWDEDFW